MSGKVKILLLGDSNVGKINFLSKYAGINSADLESKLNSLGEVHIDKEIKVENKYINIQIWDTKGQERFSSSLEKYLKKDFEGVIIILWYNKQGIFWTFENKLFNNCGRIH